MIAVDGFYFVCRMWDSNPRSIKQTILSRPPLTARETLLWFDRLHLVLIKHHYKFIAVCSLFNGSREARTPDPGLIRPVLYQLSYRTNGTLGGDRTHNLQIRSLTLYPLRYEGISYLAVYFYYTTKYDIFHYTIYY